MRADDFKDTISDLRPFLDWLDAALEKVSRVSNTLRSFAINVPSCIDRVLSPKVFSEIETVEGLMKESRDFQRTCTTLGCVEAFIHLKGVQFKKHVDRTAPVTATPRSARIATKEGTERLATARHIFVWVPHLKYEKTNESFIVEDRHRGGGSGGVSRSLRKPFISK